MKLEGGLYRRGGGHKIGRSFWFTGIWAYNRGGGGGRGAYKQQFTVTYRNGLQRSSAAFSTKLIYSVITVKCYDYHSNLKHKYTNDSSILTFVPLNHCKQSCRFLSYNISCCSDSVAIL